MSILLVGRVIVLVLLLVKVWCVSLKFFMMSILCFVMFFGGVVCNLLFTGGEFGFSVMLCCVFMCRLCW